MRQLIFTNMENYTDYFYDESRSKGYAESISFPQNEQELLLLASFFYEKKVPITVQGSKTGITGGAVPFSGHIMNLSRMKRIKGMEYNKDENYFSLTVEPGLTLKELQESIAAKTFVTANWSKESLAAYAEFQKSGSWFFPPDPTETTASIGGIVSCDASGARSFLYGSTRNHITGLTVYCPGKGKAVIKRGTNFASGFNFSIPAGSTEFCKGILPAITTLKIKNAAGYFIKPDMDMIDLFIGAEGTLGIITEINIKLTPLPCCIWGATFFLPDEERAADFVEFSRDHRALLKPAAIEFFDSRALKMLDHAKKTNPAFSRLPIIPDTSKTAVYVEYHCNQEEVIEQSLEAAVEQLRKLDGIEDQTWLSTNQHEMQRTTWVRHCVPELVNQKISMIKKDHKSIIKLGTDMAAGDLELREIMRMYNSDLLAAGLDYVKFGHIGDNHIHVNIIPANQEESDKGRLLYLKWAKIICQKGGTISAEHGVGKLKVNLLKLMFGDDQVKQMYKLKKIFDPDNLLNRGNIFKE